MFNLDHAISDWRRQMAAGGIGTPEILDELETHLREDVDQQVRSGLSQQQAFEAAVQRIGESKALKKEFRKVSRHRAWGFRDNPLTLNILAVWLLGGFECIRSLHRVLTRFGFPPRYGDLLAMGIVILFAILSILLGIGLLRRNNVCRVCVIAWFALNITYNLGHIAMRGLSYAPHIPAHGRTVQYIVFWGQLFNAAMWFFGLFLLTKPSVRKLFRPVSA